MKEYNKLFNKANESVTAVIVIEITLLFYKSAAVFTFNSVHIKLPSNRFLHCTHLLVIINSKKERFLTNVHRNSGGC